MHLRSYGEHLRILQPASLAEAMVSSLKATLAQYPA
jgi:predicted DNA-binding transcriptional regulator YafY